MARWVLGAALVTAAVALAAAGLSAPAQEKAKEAKAVPPVKWEYQVVDLPPLNEEAGKQLTKLGEEGWEAAGVGGDVSARSTGANQGVAGTSTKLRVVLKRPKG